MEKMKNLIVLAAILLTACENTAYPLVFVSENTVGIEIAGPSADNPGGGSIVIGYKGRDAALVPTGVILSDEDKRYKVLTLLNGCSNDGGGTGNDAPGNDAYGDCSAHVTRLHLQQAMENRADINTKLGVIALKASELARKEKNEKIKDKLITLAKPEGIPKGAGQEKVLGEISAAFAVSENPEVRALATKLTEVNKETVGNSVTIRKATQVDSYSVFSSFNADSGGQVGGEKLSAGLSLGKLFATGVAAQHLGRGMAENLKNIGATKQMSKAEALAGCVNLLKAENDGKSKPGDTDKCLNFLTVVTEKESLPGPPEISVLDAEADEDSGKMTFVLTREPAIGVSKVAFSANNVTAFAGTDYTASAGSITFLDGMDKNSIEITLINEATKDGDKKLELSLDVQENAVLKRKKVTGTIKDND